MAGSDGGDEEKPEPEEEIELLVDDVVGENTDGVGGGLSATRPEVGNITHGDCGIAH